MVGRDSKRITRAGENQKATPHSRLWACPLVGPGGDKKPHSCFLNPCRDNRGVTVTKAHLNRLAPPPRWFALGLEMEEGFYQLCVSTVHIKFAFAELKRM